MLRTRFTFAVAAAVAVVTLAITAVAFLVVRSDLQNQVSQELRAQSAAVHRQAQRYHGHIPAGWVPPHPDRFGASSPYEQVVTAGGAIWAPAGDRGLLPADAAAVAVAAGQRGSYYRETTLGGVRAMVLTTPLAPGLALQVAAPLNTVDTEVASVGATLALLSAIGVALAALAGWGVARAGLAPVGRLAAVAEQVTATGDPASRVEVDRADELGRLATSFNTMLHVLQRSLTAQRQLVSDASHELRTPLTSLRINVELLADDPGLSGPERQEVLDRVVAQVGELGQLVANVPGWPGASRPPARSAPSGSRRWWRQAWRAPGGTGRRPRSRPIWSRASSSAAPGGCRSPSVTCWTTRPSLARWAPRWRYGCSPGSSPCATTGPVSRPPTCRMSSTASTGPRRPGACQALASGSLSCARWRKATAGRSGPKPRPAGEP